MESKAEWLKMGEENLKLFHTYDSNPEWKLFSESPCLSYERFIDSRRVVKGVFEAPLPAAAVLAYLDDVSNITTTDKLCIEARYLLKDEDFSIAYLQFKAVWPVSNRDFVMLNRKFVDGNKTYYVNRSVNYNVPEVNGVVRAEIMIGSFCVEKLSEDKCRITYISHSDPKGDIPEAIKNMASKHQS